MSRTAERLALLGMVLLCGYLYIELEIAQGWTTWLYVKYYFWYLAGAIGAVALVCYVRYWWTH